jgi:mono/diheme cytochrome c family protein
LLIVALAVLAGCGRTEPPRFRLNMEGRNRADVPLEHQQAVVNALEAAFGTPDDVGTLDKPHVFPEAGLDIKKLQLAAGPSMTRQTGARQGLYRQHCAHCHGISGDGLGPTAGFLNPYPRDYRKGIFKFTSTGDGAKPTTADLKRTITDGVAGTAMPAFSLLPEDEIDALTEYVKYLSLRGETEALLTALVENEGPGYLTRDVVLNEAMMPIVEFWNSAPTQVVQPPARPAEAAIDTPEQLAASIEAGRKLFLNTKRGQCLNCHGPTGLGDGGDPIFDAWNDPKEKLRKTGDEGAAQVALLYSLPIQRLQPRNLQLGIYRGGRRPLDLYRRIHAGIKGANMPAAGATPQKPDGLSPTDIWNLVDYVRSLPYDSGVAAPQPHATAQLQAN